MNLRPPKYEARVAPTSRDFSSFIIIIIIIYLFNCNWVLARWQ
jgi:hypothetical protein